MFLWSLEVEFPHPINTNTKEENAAISYENSIKIAREVENFASSNIDTRDEDIDILSDDDDDDDNENPGPRSSILCSNGNTTSGGDLNSVENRLLILSGTQIRVEMYGIEKREKVRIAIDEPVYYETFRQCHHVEWESTCIKD